MENNMVMTSNTFLMKNPLSLPHLNIHRWREILTAGSSETKVMFHCVTDDLEKQKIG